MVLFLIVVVEISCFFTAGMPTAYNKEFKMPGLGPEHISSGIGTMPRADSVYHKVLVKDNDTVFDVNYSVDSFHKRITPNHSSAKDKYALFFGCSIVYGTGVEDDETFPYQFQELSENTNSYNFSYEGHGTNHMLARLQYQDLSEQVRENDGEAFYVFFWDHIVRSIGSMDRYCDWLYNAPYYTMQDNRLVRKKMFKDGRRMISKSYELFHQTSIKKQFKVDFPVKLKFEHFDLVTQMILESKKEYAKQFGNDNFSVIFPPVYKEYSDEDFETFKSILEEKEINYYDLSTFIEYKPEYTLGGDPHPNPNTHKMTAEELLQRINN